MIFFRIGLQHTFNTCGIRKHSNKTTMFIMDYTTKYGDFKQTGWSRCSRLMLNYYIKLDKYFLNEYIVNLISFINSSNW